MDRRQIRSSAVAISCLDPSPDPRVMSLPPLSYLLSPAHARALAATGIPQKEVSDPLFEERIQRICAQLAAAIALRALLDEVGIRAPDTIDLHPLINLASVFLSKKEAGVLHQINQKANEAKHRVEFVSRM